MTTVPANLIRVRPGGQDRVAFDQTELEDLAASIDRDGCISVPVVRPVGDSFEIVAGERRVRAMRDVLGWSEIPVSVRELDDETAARMMLSENVVRVDLDPMTEARAYQDRLDRFDGMTPARIAVECGIPAPRVRDRLKLLALSEHVAHFVATRQIPMGHAMAMVALDKPRQALALQAFQDGAASIAVFREVCSRLLDEQAEESASGLFDGGSFLQNPEWCAEITDYVTAEPARELVREECYGLDELAERLEIGLSQLRAMVRREAFPAPDLTVARQPAWWATTVETWVSDTGHGIPLTFAV